eukprot:6214640-Pleurochrysis_carterae.AAC.1
MREVTEGMPRKRSGRNVRPRSAQNVISPLFRHKFQCRSYLSALWTYGSRIGKAANVVMPLGGMGVSNPKCQLGT